jgi:hypothetical protein
VEGPAACLRDSPMPWPALPQGYGAQVGGRGGVSELESQAPLDIHWKARSMKLERAQLVLVLTKYLAAERTSTPQSHSSRR